LVAIGFRLTEFLLRGRQAADVLVPGPVAIWLPEPVCVLAVLAELFAAIGGVASCRPELYTKWSSAASRLAPASSPE